MPASLGSGDDGTPNDFTAAIARRLGVNQPAGLQSGYQYSSGSPSVQDSQPMLQDTRTALTPQAAAPTQQAAGSNSFDAGANSAPSPSNAAAALAQMAAFNRAQQGGAPSGFAPAPLNFGTSPFAPNAQAQAPNIGGAIGGGLATIGGAIGRAINSFRTPSSQNPSGFAPAPLDFGTSPLAPQPLDFGSPPTGTSTPTTATPTGSTTPITDAFFAAKNGTTAGGGNTLDAGPTSSTGTVGAQPTPSQPTIQNPTAGTPGAATPAIGGTVGAQPTPTGQTAPTTASAGATGSVTPIISQGSQSGTGTVPTSGGLPQQGSGGPMNPSAQPSELNTITQQAASDLTGLQSMIQNAKSPDVLNVFLQQGQSIMDMLKQQETQLRADAQKNGTTIDPATQFTLDTMQKQLDTQLSGVRDNLNRRGLLQSGIELASENQVRSGNLSAEGQLLSTRLSNIQKNLEAGLQSVNSQRFTAMKDFGMGGAQAQATADNNTITQRDNMMRQLVSSRLALRGQMNAANEGNLSRQNAASIADANRQSQQGIAAANLQASGNRLNQTQQFSAQQSALQQQASDARQAASLAAAAGNIGLKQAYDAQAADLQRQFQASQNAIYKAPASTTPSPTPTGSKLSTDNFIVQLENAPDKQSATDAFNQAVQDGTFANAGADPVAVLNAINQKQWGGTGFKLPFGIGQ